MSSWLHRGVLAYAHQGGAREAPSSTLYAIEQALRAGANAIELDVHATADGHVVVCHDQTLDRTTDGSGAVATLTLAEIRRLDNAYWWVPGEQAAVGRPEADYVLRGRAPEDRSLGVATLDEVLSSFPGVIVNLDIKQTAPAVEPYEHLVADVLRSHGRATTDDVIVASFWDSATDRFSAVAPEVPVSLGTMGTTTFWQAVQSGVEWVPTRHVALQVPPQAGGMTVVDQPFVERAHDAGLAVHVWTIDQPDEMNRLLDLGVDGIITDVPSVLARVLALR